jgi:hypothetical protein
MGTKLFGLLFIIIGLGSLVLSIKLYRDTSHFVKTALPTQGTVIENTRQGAPGTRIRYTPKVRFIVSGSSYEFVSLVGSNPASYTIGQPVSVLYTPGTPSNARINRFKDLWFGPLISLIIGLLFPVAGLLAFTKSSSITIHIKG